MDLTAAPIIHVVQHLRPGGLEVLALELARVQAAFRPTFVLSLEGEAQAAIAAWPRLAAQRHQLLFAGKRAGRDAGLPIRLAARFRALRPAAVHTHHIGPLLYAGAAARLAGVPRVLHTEHDAWHLNDRRRRRVARLALALARPLVIADAPHVARAMAQALGGPAPRVVLNGIDTDRFCPGDRRAARAALGLPADDPVIGVAARLERVKGVDVAIAALAALPPGVTLAIAGTGAEAASLREQAARLGLAARVRFLGHVDDMIPFHRAIDLLCLPSRDEGLPLSLLEAQACGTPVVATDVGAVAAAVAPGGMLVAKEDPRALAAAMATLLAAPPAARPRDFVAERGSLRRAADTYLALAA